MTSKFRAYPQTVAYRNNRNGYMDRASKIAPRSNDIDYFRGYCARIIAELRESQAAK
jgi:hypothetical protein